MRQLGRFVAAALEGCVIDLWECFQRSCGKPQTTFNLIINVLETASSRLSINLVRNVTKFDVPSLKFSFKSVTIFKRDWEAFGSENFAGNL